MFEEVEVNSERWLDLKDLKNEIWKDIEGYEGLYQVSSLGRIKSIDRIIKYKKNNEIITYLKKGRIMKPHNNGRDYLNIQFRDGNIRKHLYIHIIVAKAFIPNPYNLEQVNHKNFNKTDNRVENLEWCTRKNNMLHYKQSSFFKEVQIKRQIASHNKTIRKIKKFKDIIIKKYINGETIENISTELKISRDFVSDIVYLFSKEIAFTARF